MFIYNSSNHENKEIYIVKHNIKNFFFCFIFLIFKKHCNIERSIILDFEKKTHSILCKMWEFLFQSHINETLFFHIFFTRCLNDGGNNSVCVLLVGFSKKKKRNEKIVEISTYHEMYKEGFNLSHAISLSSSTYIELLSITI